MKNNKILYPIFLLSIILGSCNYENPLDTEQYEKTVYLIGASDNLLTKTLSYSSQHQNTFLSVGVSGSLLIDNDITVGLSSHNSVIDWYNTKFKYLPTDLKYQALDADFYNIPSYNVTLEAGNAYAKLPIEVTTEGLHCDSLYALTFKIDSSSDYMVNKTDSALIVTFNLVNAYSGNYIFNGVRQQLDENGNVTGLTSISNTLRTFKATDENSVRFYHEQQAETVANIKNYGIVLNVSANNSVTVTAWEDFDLVEGTCTYNPSSKVFDISYTYHLGGNTYRMEGAFTYQVEEGEE